MLTKHLKRFLTTPASKVSNYEVIFWFSLSLIFATIYGTQALAKAFRSEYIVQDDARQHVFWMRRFLDPELFPNDLIADYFQSVAPLGYTTFYKLFAVLGIDPILLSKFLPVVLGLVTTSYFFGLCLQILPVPATGFIGAMLLNQNLWCRDDLASGTPRAFLYLLFLAFLYYLLRGEGKRPLLSASRLLCWGAIALQGLFYPQCVFISAGVLIVRLLSWEDGKVRLSQRQSDYWFCAAGLAVALLVLLPYALMPSQFGPIISVAQAKTLPEFWPGGRASFFDNNPWMYWLGGRSGMIPGMLLTPVTLSAGLLLPILLRYPSRLPLVREIKSKIILLLQLIIVSFCLFFTAHAVLFKLHLPNRYTQHSLRIVLILAAAIALTLLLDAVFYWAQNVTQSGLVIRQVLALGIVGLLGIAIVMYPSSLKNFPRTNYQTGTVPALYKFFSQQPKDSLIASLAKEADNLPTFSQRSVLVSREYGIPYHIGYYHKFRERALNLIQAQYSSNLAEVQNLIQKYGLDFWLLEQTSFEPEYIANNSWLKQFQPVATDTQVRLEQGSVPALVGLIDSCSVFKVKSFIVLGAECIKNAHKTL